MPVVAWRADGRDGCGQARHATPRDTMATLMDALMTVMLSLLGSREVGRVALSARGGERGDADGSAEGDRTAHLGAARGGLAAVGGVAAGAPRQRTGAVNQPIRDFQPGRGDPVVAPWDLPIEPGQLTLAENVHEAGPGLAVEGVGPCGVALPGPVRVGRPGPLGEAEQLREQHVLEPPLGAQRLRPQVALNPHDVGPTVVREPVLAREHRRVDGDVAVVVERDELERLWGIHVIPPAAPLLLPVLFPLAI